MNGKERILLNYASEKYSKLIKNIQNLLNNKVNKAGDTMTGFLDFDNKNDYHVLRKKRTIDGIDYTANFGIGMNKSARIELGDKDYNALGILEVRDDEKIWNGKSNRRIPEVEYCAWSPSITFKMTGGHALVMINHTDCLMLWVGGSYPNQSLNVIRLYGTDAQASFDVNNQTVTINFQDGRRFTCTAIIGNG